MSTAPIILQPGTYSVPPPAPPVTINSTFIPAVQNAPFELLWGVGRSKPVNNPPVHGTATWTQGSPSVLTYAPADLPNDRDNIYCLRRMGNLGLPDFSKATYFSESEVYAVSDVLAPEALETDWHMQPVGTKIINPGLQFLAGKPWNIRLWDQVKGSWQDAGVTFDGNILSGQGALFAAEYTVIPGTSFSCISVSVNGLKFPFKNPYTQPLKNGSAVTSPVFNKAVQADANGVATPYTLKVDQLTLIYR
jgi:hypothetical protein